MATGIASLRRGRHTLWAKSGSLTTCRCGYTSKGKRRDPYEFGIKFGLAMTLKGNLIVSASNHNGGHTMHEKIEQSDILMQGRMFFNKGLSQLLRLVQAGIIRWSMPHINPSGLSTQRL